MASDFTVCWMAELPYRFFTMAAWVKS